MARIVIPILGLIAATAYTTAAAAQTKACHQEIARLQALVGEAEAGGSPVPDLPESNFATKHRQPTPATVSAAKKESTVKAQATLDLARKYETEGKEADCLRALDDIALPPSER